MTTNGFYTTAVQSHPNPLNLASPSLGPELDYLPDNLQAFLNQLHHGIRKYKYVANFLYLCLCT